MIPQTFARAVQLEHEHRVAEAVRRTEVLPRSNPIRPPVAAVRVRRWSYFTDSFRLLPARA